VWETHFPSSLLTSNTSFPSLNRIGNLLVPNSNYCKFEDWVLPILDKLVEEQEEKEFKRWTPSEVIHRLGKEIDNEDSVYYWCYKVRFHAAKT
jgi:deoxyhypusine synthase